MHRWWGSSQDSDRQASERDRRAARRTIAQLPTIASSGSEDEYADCNLSTSFILNVDGGNDSDSASTHSDIMPNFDVENGVDDADYYKKLGPISNRTFNTKEPEFWFTSIESSLKHIGVKSQWSKREILQNLLPEAIQLELKHLFRKDKDSAGDTPYKDIKTELLKLYKPKKEDAFERALSRKLSDFAKPSAFGKALIDDICVCDSPLQSECCQRVIGGLWVRQLPLVIRQRLAGQDFSVASYKSMFELADALYKTPTTTHQPVIAAVSSVSSPPSALNETQPALQHDVAALTKKKNKKNKNRNATPSGSDSSKPRWPTPRHADNPPLNTCFNHHTHGRTAFFCSDPLSCEWRNIPPNPRPKPTKKD